MNTKKAPTSAATLAEAAAEMTAYRASIPISDCTTTTTGRQRKVSDFLNHGQENAVPLRLFCRTMRRGTTCRGTRGSGRDLSAVCGIERRRSSGRRRPWRGAKLTD